MLNQSEIIQGTADSEFGEGILSVPQLHLKEFNFTGGVSG